MKLGLPLAVLLGCALAACGSDSKKAEPPAIEVPDRSATPGDSILAMVPAGADSILELDVGRLRQNDVVGDVVTALTAGAKQANQRSGGLNLLGAGDLVVFVSYGIGKDDTERLVIVKGSGSTAIQGAYQLDDDTVALTSGKMEKRLALVAAGKEPSLATASPLVRLRALAMPEKADGASLRLAAHLDFDARVALARALDVDEVPVSVSVWGDVADDLAIVALVSGEDVKEGRKLAGALEQIRNQLAALTIIRAVGLSRIVRAAAIEKRGAAARMVLLVGPRRLGRVVERVLKRLKEDAV